MTGRSVTAHARPGPRAGLPGHITGRLALCLAAFGLLMGCAQEDPPHEDREEPQAGAHESGSVEREEDVAADRHAAVRPARLEVPEIEIDEGLIDLDIQADGTLEAPSEWNDVGWFAGGPNPGEPGATVFAAHVDSPTGPAVFYRLVELVEGDEVVVEDADGHLHTYRVEHTADYPKDDFPTQEVFGAAPEDELRLITCTGEFDDSAQRHLDNRVVFASRS